MHTRKTISISVIIPVYNIINYVNECLQSLSAQKDDDVEFIVVDDGSTDGSGDICDRWQASDERFRVLHQENKGLLLARKAGVQVARGKYLTFLDGDDLFTKNALFRMKQLVNQKHADVTKFSGDVFGGRDIGQADAIRQLVNGDKTVTPCSVHSSVDAASIIYKERHIGWYLWSRIFKTDIVKKAYSYCKEEFCLCAEDAYMQFIICYFAKTYEITVSEPLYLYRLNTGVSTRSTTLELYSQQVNENRITEWIAEFLKRVDATPFWYDCLNGLKKRLTATAVNRFAELPEKSMAQGLSLLLKYHEIIHILPRLEIVFSDCQGLLAEACRLALPKCTITSSTAKNPTVGIFYHRYYNGGVERVISLQIPIFQSIGYRVVLFTEEIKPDLEYSLPESVERVRLPLSYANNRAELMQKAVKDYGITVFCYHAASYHLLLFDLILLRTLHVSVVLTSHENTFSKMASGSPYGFNRVAVHALADTVVVLSSMEELFYRQCGINARYVPNPVEYSRIQFSSEFTQSTNFEEKTRPVVLWIGRLDDHQKNFREALQIFREIAMLRSDVLCYVIGSGTSESDRGNDAWVDQFIADHGLSQQIVHVPFTNTVDTYYQMASVQLLTSSFEGFPMVMLEGKIHGLPLVTYDLPYLELLRSGGGYISVPRHNVHKAASAVISILNDLEFGQILRNEAQESLKQFLRFDLRGAWNEILGNPCQTWHAAECQDREEMNCLFWDQTMLTYNEGVARLHAKIDQLQSAVVRLQSDATWKGAVKTILKKAPIIAPCLNFLLPQGSRRRRFARDVVRALFRKRG